MTNVSSANLNKALKNAETSHTTNMQNEQKCALTSCTSTVPPTEFNTLTNGSLLKNNIPIPAIITDESNNMSDHSSHSPSPANDSNIYCKPASPTNTTTVTPETVVHSATSGSSNYSSTPDRSCSPLPSTSRQVNQKDIDEIQRLFEEKPEAFEKWLTERAPPEALMRLQEFIESRKAKPKRPSVTSDLFQQWMASSPVQVGCF